MKVIVLASQKGGAGKTTIAAHLGVAAEKAGAGPVVFMDVDPQGSLSNWWNARAQDAPSFANMGDGGLIPTLDGLRKSGVNLVVIDTPGVADAAIASIIAAADLVVVPVVPSPHDLGAINATLEMVEASGREMVFVVNNASTNGRLTGEAVAVLSEFGVVAKAVISTRQDYRSTMSGGGTVLEVRKPGKAADEAGALWTYIAAMLDKGSRRRGQRTVA